MKTFSRRLCQLLIVVLLVTGQPSLAALPESARAASSPAAAPGQALQPVETLLRPDGTLNLRTGFSGSLDPRGWRMVCLGG